MALTATDLFNDATTREIGGVGPDQVNLIVSDLIGVQQMLAAAVPTINNLSDLHTQVIINQLNEEIASIENANSPTGTLVLGTDLGQFVGRAINDIHRDIIDIAQGDAGVQALFNPTPLPALNSAPAPFHDSADQTAFVTQWIQDSNHLGQMAQTIANNGFQGDVAGLVQQIQTFNTNSNAFDMSQGGLFSARFWNEFRTDGTSGTAATALIEGLQTQNAGEVAAAVEQLATNSADVGTNNLMADGGSYAAVVAAAQATAVTPTGGNAAAPAAAADAAAAAAPAAAAAAATPAPAAAAAAGLTATDLFNDATTREIGGIGPDQVNLIVSDLVGVQQMLAAAVPTINNLSDLHTQVIINQLNEEIASVENVNSPTGTLVLGTDLGQYVGRAINDIHRDIIDIAQGDAGVQALLNPTPLPALNTPPAPFHDSADQTAFVTQWIQDSNHLGQMAQTIANNGFTGDIAGLVQQLQTFNTNSNAFDMSQGGLFSARFWNEFRTDGTSGTAATALIDGSQTQNAGEVAAAVEQLATNSADVGTNNRMADGGSYAAVVAAAQATAVTPGGGNAAAPAAAADAAAAAAPAAAAAAATPAPAAAAAAGLTATDLFNDATTREIGGIGPDQVNLIVSDLVGVQQMLAAAVPTINNLSDLHTQVIINQLNEEIASVEN